MQPASAPVADADDDDDDDDDQDDGDPFDIPEESDDFNALAVRSSPGRKAVGAEKQTAELELELMSNVERKEKMSRGKGDDSYDVQSTSTSRTGSGRQKVR